MDPDHAWQRQNDEQQNNVLYQYVNLQRQGRLIDVYNGQGLEALDALIVDELAAFLYDDGMGQLVSNVQYKAEHCL